jgi:hypothetical protein
MGTRDESPDHATQKRHPLADASFERLMEEADRMPQPCLDGKTQNRGMDGDEKQALEEGDVRSREDSCGTTR